MHPGLSLQTAMHGALVGHAPLTALLGGATVFDHVPQGTVEPYVAFGETSSREWDTQTLRGHEHFILLHVWTRARGRKLAQEIAGEIEDALDATALTLDGHRLVDLRLASAKVGRGDGERFHAVLRFRALTEAL